MDYNNEEPLEPPVIAIPAGNESSTVKTSTGDASTADQPSSDVKLTADQTSTGDVLTGDQPASGVKLTADQTSTGEVKNMGENQDIQENPGLVVAVLGDPLSLVPKPWNTIKFTSSLKKVVEGANNSWIYFRRTDSVAAHIIKAFLSENNLKDFKTMKGTGFFQILQKEKEVQPVPTEFKNILSELKEISMKTTPLIERLGRNDQEQEWTMLVPVIMIVVEGDTETIQQVSDAVKKGIPVCVIKGSGEAADFIADSIHQSEKREIKSRAARHFGVCFENDDFVQLEDNLKNINQHSHLVGVFDVNDPNANMEDAIVNVIINAWSFMEAIPNENQTTKYKSITDKVVKPPKVKKGLMQEYQLRLSPGSLSLYFYIAYQYIQYSIAEEDKEIGVKDLKLLLVEAIVANLVDYVSSMLQNGVEFDENHLSILYNESVICSGCNGIDCIKTHSIHHKINAELSSKIWRCCKDSKDPSTCPWHNKEIEQNDTNGQKDENVQNEASAVKADSRRMCRLILEHDGVDDKNTMKETKEHKKNTKEVAAIMASSLLKNMADSVDSAKYRKLKEELLHHSKLFETRVIDMQTTMYEENEIDAMILMDTESTFWGVHISPMECAFENNMIDVIGHPCIQRKLDRIWYNRLNFKDNKVSPDKSQRAHATKLTHWSKNLFCCCCFGSSKFFNSLISPVSAFITHYLTVLALLVIFSAFILTNINTVNSVSDIGVYEWLLYVWLVADIIEEYIVPLTMSNRFRKTSKQSNQAFWFKLKRTVWNFWNFLTFMSHLFIVAGVMSRYIPTSANTDRITLRLFSLGLFTMYMRFLQCMLVQSYFGPKLIMIGEMLVELIKFVWILIVFMMCTGVLYHANMYPSHYDMWSPKGPKYWRIWKIISLPYWQIYGELFLEDLQGDNNANGSCTYIEDEWEANPDIERCVEYDWALLLIAALYLLITNLLLVNLIIALFSYRFDEVQKDSDRLWKFSRYSIIITFRKKHPVPYNLLTLFPRLLLFAYFECGEGDDKKADVFLIKEQESHAIRCLETQI